MLRVLVVDDEPLARKNMQLQLADVEGVKSMGEAANAAEALDWLERSPPDLMMLDIEMPGMNGIELAERIGDRCPIIFVTAYNEYAVQAFDLHAVDYLLKPVKADRLQLAVDKIIKRKQEHLPIDYRQVANLVEQLNQQQPQFQDRLSIKEGGRIRIIDTDQISFIAGAGNYSHIHLVDGERIMHRATLSDMEISLDPDGFIRVHRSMIVRRKSVCEVSTTDKGDYLLLMRCGQSLALSRRHRERLQNLLC